MQYRHLQMVRISLVVMSLGKHFIRLKHMEIFKTMQKSYNKILPNEGPEYDY